jgi:hypothetical protein
MNFHWPDMPPSSGTMNDLILIMFDEKDKLISLITQFATSTWYFQHTPLSILLRNKFTSRDCGKGFVFHFLMLNSELSPHSLCKSGG